MPGLLRCSGGEGEAHAAQVAPVAAVGIAAAGRERSPPSPSSTTLPVERGIVQLRLACRLQAKMHPRATNGSVGSGGGFLSFFVPASGGEFFLRGWRSGAVGSSVGGAAVLRWGLGGPAVCHRRAGGQSRETKVHALDL